MTKELEALVQAARRHPFVPSEMEEQRRSFAYGNAKIENALISRATVDQEAEKLELQGR